MTRPISGVIAFVPLALGVTFAGGDAQADTIYEGPFPTVTTVQTPPDGVKKHHRATVCATVTMKTGTANPVGDVSITVTRNIGPYSVTATYPYAGGQVCLQTEKLHKSGGYLVAASYTARAGTIFTDSANAAGFDVTKPRR